MANDLEVVIGADTKPLSTGLGKATTSLKDFASEASKTSAALGGSLAKGADTAAFALTNTGRVLQDLPFGFVGIQNNLNPLLESFGRLRAETGSAGGALKALGASLIGPAGLGLALSAVSAGILLYQQYQQRTKKVTDDSTKSIAEQREEFIKTPYQKAYTELSELTRNIGLAKDGVLDKTAVLKQYNTGLGATIGKVSNLDEAEQMLVKNGDAYLKLMFLKANAEFAFKKAAEDSYKLSQKQAEIDAKAPKISDKFKIDADRSKKAVETGLTGPLKSYLNVTNQVSSGLDGINSKVQIVSKNLGEQLADASELKSLEKTSGKAVDIAKNAQQQVINFAKQNGFNLNGLFDIKSDKAKPVENKREDEFNGRGLEDVSGRIALGLDGIVEQYKKTEEQIGKVSLVPPIVPMIDGYNKLTAEARKFNEQIGSILTQGAVDAFASLGTAIGSGLVGASDVIATLGSSLIGAISSMCAQLGKLAIATGVGMIAIKLAFKNPATAIAAGVALIALSGVAASAARGIVSGGGSGGGDVSGGGSSTPSYSTVQAGSSVNSFNGGHVVFEIAGQKLVGVLSNTLGANNRIIGKP